MAACLRLLFVFLAIHLVCCQDFTWTWLHGSQKSNSQESKTDPGGRSGAAHWDMNEEIWVFGGEQHAEHKHPGLKNDLWMYDQITMSWHLVHNGTAASVDDVPAPRQLAAGCGIPYTYFVLFGGLGEGEKVLNDTWLFYIKENKWYKLDEIRVKLGARNMSSSLSPAARGDSAVWCHGELEMSVFGGFGERQQLLHDMWIFDLKEMSWSEPESSAKLPRDPEFVKHLWYPDGRSGATTWVTHKKLYMYGGNIAATNVRSKHLNFGNTGDMWEYNKLDDTWSILKGSVCTSGASYGKAGVNSWGNYPGCRRRASSWVDSHGNLWMFGGDGIDNMKSSLSMISHSKLLSDVWYFDLGTLHWTWKGGEQSGDQKGDFGEMGKAGKHYIPGSRCESIFWAGSNKFYLFGGVGHDGFGKDGYLNDVWQLDVSYDASVCNSPQTGPVFGLIFLGLFLITLTFVLFFFNRGQNNQSQMQRGKYSILQTEAQ